MLRFLVLLFLLVNTGYFVWSQGWLDAWTGGARTQNEPQRLAAQLAPEAMRVLTAPQAESWLAQARAAKASQAQSLAMVCVQAGLFDEAQSLALRSALDAELPPSAWTLASAVEPARWIIYVGKFPNAVARERKRSELLDLGLSIEAIRNPTLEPGMSLGHFATEAAARAALAGLAPRGVRSATVVQESGELQGSRLTLPAVDEALRAKLQALPALAGKALLPC